ncbi:MAG: hypothetical protein GF364_03885 [Candidatus Lokiarchaeota archaeon]|nr:hypothetical protein [Candidatus Lokiarchaeota archaeon]
MKQFQKKDGLFVLETMLVVFVISSGCLIPVNFVLCVGEWQSGTANMRTQCYHITKDMETDEKWGIEWRVIDGSLENFSVFSFDEEGFIAFSSYMGSMGPFPAEQVLTHNYQEETGEADIVATETEGYYFVFWNNSTAGSVNFEYRELSGSPMTIVALLVVAVIFLVIIIKVARSKKKNYKDKAIDKLN